MTEPLCVSTTGAETAPPRVLRDHDYPNLRRVAGPGRPPGSLNKLTRLVKEQLVDEITSGRKTHPALVLLDICNSSRVSVAVRRAAASDLLAYLMPQKHSIEVEPPEAADEERIQSVKRKLAALWVEEINNVSSSTDAT